MQLVLLRTTLSRTGDVQYVICALHTHAHTYGSRRVCYVVIMAKYQPVSLFLRATFIAVQQNVWNRQTFFLNISKPFAQYLFTNEIHKHNNKIYYPCVELISAKIQRAEHSF